MRFLIHERRGTSFLWGKTHGLSLHSVNVIFLSSQLRKSWRFVLRCFNVSTFFGMLRCFLDDEVLLNNCLKKKKFSGEAARVQISRALALAGCDCSERANAGKVFPPSAPFSRHFQIFVLRPVRGHLVRLATTSSAFPPKDAETMRRARSHCGDAAYRGLSGNQI